jgi:hypothetical protein
VKYLMLFWENPTNWIHPTGNYSRGITSDEIRAEVEKINDQVMEEISDSGELVDGTPLDAPQLTKTIRRQGRKPVVTDGPFIESREQLAGFFVLECESMERAVEIACKFPGFEPDGIEIRAISTFEEPQAQ